MVLRNIFNVKGKIWGIYYVATAVITTKKNEEISRKTVGILIPKPYILLVLAS